MWKSTSMAAEKEEAHRPGAFKQQNKSHKTGRHRSKGQLEKATKGAYALLCYMFDLLLVCLLAVLL